MYIVTIQSSFEDVIKDINNGAVKEEAFWVAIRAPNENQHLYNVNFNGQFENDKIKFIKKPNKYIVKRDDEVFELVTGRKFVPFNGVTAVRKWGPKLLLGLSAGAIAVYDLDEQKVEKTIAAHYLDVTQIKVFSNNKVFMSVGLDNQIKLWSEWANIRAMVSDLSSNVEFVGKGRNFVVGRKDGAVELWECGTAKPIYEFESVRKDRVVAVRVIEKELDNDPSFRLDLEFETENKELAVAHEGGHIEFLSLLKKETLKTLNVENSVSSLEVYGTFLLVGSNAGKFQIYDINSYELKLEHQLTPNAVKLWVVNDKVVVYNGEEVLVLLDIDWTQFKVTKTQYLVGLPEFFKVESVHIDNDLIVVASDYGVMIYSL